MTTKILLKDIFPGSKFQATYEDRPWIVSRRQGSLIVAQRGTEQVVRNISHFKRFWSPPSTSDVDGIDNPISSDRDDLFDDELVSGSESMGDVETGSLESPDPENNVGASGNNDLSPSKRTVEARYKLRWNPSPSIRLRDYLL
ncbi:hypothetical protein NDU88_002614 [Pleurodeles waltl]|uniref:Uncharacterized protein n=1 Tax=Pleurodeles waltl TaxID=8319 RepID=A0AAV7PEJ3_PLEWA|nr:hypothetical protein NDU88_002614 [Pleurodeles waltl]